MQKRILNIRYGWRGIDGGEIAPGEYREDDTALLGKAAYLLDNGHAQIVGVIDTDAPSWGMGGYVEPKKDVQPEPEQVEPEPESESEEIAGAQPEQPTTAKRSRR